MGEHLGNERFRVVKVSVQRSGGNQACFIRNPHDHRAELEEFFEETGRDYARFNYLGEWHSHPSFESLPSGTDIQTMQSIVEDPEVGVHFLVLIVCRLGAERRRVIELTATAFRAGTSPLPVPISLEPESQGRNVSVIGRLRRFIGL
jgi:integrative and conjugative element protein (TIGR02256 family)